MRIREEGRKVRHRRIRKVVRGGVERPRLSVFRSLKHIYVQLIDDSQGKTLLALGSRSPEFREKVKSGGNIAAAKFLGELVGQKAKAMGIERVVFDRGGYQYHGRVQALAESARAAGLKF